QRHNTHDIEHTRGMWVGCPQRVARRMDATSATRRTPSSGHDSSRQPTTYLIVRLRGALMVRMTMQKQSERRRYTRNVSPPGRGVEALPNVSPAALWRIWLACSASKSTALALRARQRPEVLPDFRSLSYVAMCQLQILGTMRPGIGRRERAEARIQRPGPATPHSRPTSPCANSPPL